MLSFFTMNFWQLVVFISSLSPLGRAASGNLTFPPGFRWGAATAAYQVEGAWNQSDKSPSIWDKVVHEYNHLMQDRSDGDVACDSYHLWKRDIQMAKELGLDFYRFSIAWTRLVPNGFSNAISEDGKNYYNNLIDGLLAHGIQPMPTLYHWDLPQRLQDLGGWTNPLVADWFADYARVAFSLFGDRVQYWITINEPTMVCELGYGLGLVAPLIKEPEVGKYMCIKNIMMAHAKAYRVYEREFKHLFNGKLSLANHYVWYEGETDSDGIAAELTRQFQYGLYLHAVYSKEGGWPPAVEQHIAENSRREGYNSSRLPGFTQEEKNLARGTSDYIAVNHYSSRAVRQHRARVPAAQSSPFSGNFEFNVTYEGRPEWKKGRSFWFLINPAGLRNVLSWLKTRYGDHEVVITENGYSDVPDVVNDDVRINYFREYLTQVHQAITEDGVNVTGYTAWSLMDNFEWVEGYKSTFGLYQVDFSRADRPRTPRKSARYYASVARANSLDVPEPQDVIMINGASQMWTSSTRIFVLLMALLTFRNT
ncbi:myrosinase 1 [Plutella xylostella]|uniref:myrosinase 1 n=1 Tax=Plutella xylostella TaxID=51655 RepID=UPI00203235F5|nr:myrosinase 1 [Plutella xylostella]